MLNICLIMHATRSRNLGVGALTVAQVDMVRRIAGPLGAGLKITILDWKDSGPSCVSGDDIEVVTLQARQLASPFGAFARIKDADIVLDIGAGDSFADIYGAGRLRRVMWLKALCHLAGVPLVLSPQTFGPFTRPLSRRLARASLKRSALICARDEKSATHLYEIGVTGEVIVASDVALRLAAQPVAVPGKRLKVGINVSGLMMSGGYQGKNDFGLLSDYPALIRALINRFQVHPLSPEVHLVPHVICPHYPVEDDLAAIHGLQAEFCNTVCAPAFRTPGEAKGYIAELDFFTGSRMHACIAAFSSGVAVVPMAYSRKFEGLFGALGYPYCADCQSQSQADIVAQVMNGFENRAALRKDAQAALQQGLTRLQRYEEGLTKLMRNCLAGKETPAGPKHAAGVAQRLDLG